MLLLTTTKLQSLNDFFFNIGKCACSQTLESESCLNDLGCIKDDGIRHVLLWMCLFIDYSKTHG